MRRAFLAAPLLACLFFAQHHSLAQTSASAATPVLPSHFGQKFVLPGIPHAGIISDSLLRGAQPHADGFAQLNNLGVTTIVDLRAEDPGKRKWEHRQARAQDIHFLSIPVGPWSPPTDAQVAQFLSLFRGPAPPKIFVHCRFGDDRTGVFIAAYRIAYDHWSANQAIQEMNFFGFHPFWHPSMESYVRAFPARLQSDPVLAPYRLRSPSPPATE